MLKRIHSMQRWKEKLIAYYYYYHVIYLHFRLYFCVYFVFGVVFFSFLSLKFTSIIHFDIIGGPIRINIGSMVQSIDQVYTSHRVFMCNGYIFVYFYGNPFKCVCIYWRARPGDHANERFIIE